ncbi:MAG TPA: hypothetical protein VIK18_19715, partial [Pirellulales bacterium]
MHATPAIADPAIEMLAAAPASADLATTPEGRRPHFIVRVWRFAASLANWLLGLSTIVVGLSLASSVPLVQLLTLGYLLDASGRVVRTGRLRDGLVGVRPAARLGGMVLGCWLVLLPVRLIRSLATSAQLVDPGGPNERAWFVAWAVAVSLAMLHLIGALVRGG